MKMTLLTLFLIVFSYNSAQSVEIVQLEEITFNCVKDDGATESFTRVVGGYSSKKTLKITKIEYFSDQQILFIHYDDGTDLRIENISGKMKLRNGKISSRECNFDITPQSQSETVSSNQNSNDLENLILSNQDLIRRLEMKIDQLESQIESIDIPCDASIEFGQILVFSFPTHSTSNEDILKLDDGKIYIGIEMSVRGESLNFTKQFNVAFTKNSENLKGINNWSNQELSEKSLKDLGEFPESSCKFLGAAND